MNTTSFDLLVIGGGITGAGIALDAVSRGLKVALIDMQDFSAGTSSRSTKLVHGGLRYLKQYEFKLVAEVGKERKIVHANAPHLTKPEPMLLPIVKGGSMSKAMAQLGMWVYEWLAGVKKEERHQVLNAEQTLAKEPSLQKNNLLGGILFYEYRTDDARLTIEVLKEAVNRGVVALNYMKAISFTTKNGKINGAKIQDQLSKEILEVNANYVVNASGPWVDELDALDKTTTANKLHITKGVHIVIDAKRFPVKQSVYFDTHDKRMVFVIPREGKTYIGTTDTFYSGDIANPLVTSQDLQYLLKCVNNYFSNINLTANDVESGWAGLRPLINKPGKGPSEISRKDEMFESASGLITIAGGKLTGYRKMAERVIDLVAKRYQQNEGKIIPVCSTEKIILSGGDVGGTANFPNFMKSKIAEAQKLSLNIAEAEMLITRYGSNVDKLFSIIENLNKEEKSALPVLLHAQLIYCINEEMCMTPSDFLIRRTGALYFDIDTVKKWGGQVTDIMNKLLNWNEELKSKFINDLQKALSDTKPN